MYCDCIFPVWLYNYFADIILFHIFLTKLPLTSAKKKKRRREKLKRLGRYEDFKAKHRQQAKKVELKQKLHYKN